MEEDDFIIEITSSGAVHGCQMLAQTFFMPVWFSRENANATLDEYIENSYEQFKKIAGIAQKNKHGDVTLKDLQDVAETVEMVEQQYKLWKEQKD